MGVSAAQDEKKKALNLAIAQIEKSYGKGAIMKMGADGFRVRVESIPTGAINLDAAIGVGGIPRGRVTEIYGPEASGKTTLCLHVVANAQRAGGTAAYIDAEHALDTDYATKLGVDVDKLLVSQPDTGEQALEICEILVRSGAVDVIVIDSVAALVPKAEIEGEMGDAHVGLQARLMSQALRKLTGAIARELRNVAGRRILLPRTDAAPPDLARALRARLYLLHVVPEDDLRLITSISQHLQSSITPTTLTDIFYTEADRRLTQLVEEAQASDVVHERLVVTGQPADAIMSWAVAKQVQLIILGSHGRRGIEHFLMGSVAARVVHQAPCAVVVVPAKAP